MLSFFPRGVLDEILNLIESVSEKFPSYSNSSAQRSSQSMVDMAQDYKFMGQRFDTRFSGISGETCN